MKAPFPLALLALAIALPSGVASAATLEVTVHGIRNGRGHIRIGVCRKAEFLAEACVFHAVVPARPGDITTSIPESRRADMPWRCIRTRMTRAG